MNLKKCLARRRNAKQAGSMPLPNKIVEGLQTKADKIRALDSAGFSRTEIAQFLGIRYQHVRNTLVQKLSTTRSRDEVFQSVKLHQKPWPSEKLVSAGFERACRCELGENAFTYSAKAPNGAGVYAFVVDNLVMYIGLTRFGLKTRLSHYVYGHKAQKTSARIKGLIIEALKSGSKVEVLIAQPPDMEWNGLPVDGPSGLETGLIRLIKPAWNQQGNR